MDGLINKIIPFSSVDGPGNRTAIFLQGCNFNCVYCHNPETIHRCVSCGECVSHCPTGALTFKNGKVVYNSDKCSFCDACFKHCPKGASPRVRTMTARQVMDEVGKNVPFVRGITVSGGECTCQRDFLVELLTLAKEKGLTTLLDSNGSWDFSQDTKLTNLCDGVMLDVKAYACTEHIAVTGYENQTVLKNLLFLAKSGKLEEVRTVVVPGLFDAENTIRQVSRTIAPYLNKRDTRYKIIAYRPMGVRQQYQDLQVPNNELLLHLEKIARLEGARNTVII